MDCDFCVIGGGIAGVSVAARLAKHGRVLLCEAEEALGTQASGRSAALYEPNYGKPSTVALNTASAAFHSDNGVLSPRGLLMLARPDEAAAFEDDCATMHMTEISLDVAQSLLPILDSTKVTRAAHEPNAQDIDTDRLLQTFAQMLRNADGIVSLKSPVTALNHTSNRWHVTTPQGVIRAQQIVNAAGAWADEIAALAGITPIGLTPLRRSMARVPAPDGMDVSAWPMVFGPGETWYSKPDAGALLISPADEDACPPHDAWAEELTIAEGIARFETYTTHRVKRLITTWAGLRTFSPNRTLVLGPDPDVPTFIWCAGQGGYGIQSAPAASQLVADLVTGRTSEIDAQSIIALSPARFR